MQEVANDLYRRIAEETATVCHALHHSLVIGLDKSCGCLMHIPVMAFNLFIIIKSFFFFFLCFGVNFVKEWYFVLVKVQSQDKKTSNKLGKVA